MRTEESLQSGPSLSTRAVLGVRMTMECKEGNEKRTCKPLSEKSSCKVKIEPRPPTQHKQGHRDRSSGGVCDRTSSKFSRMLLLPYEIRGRHHIR